MRPLLVLAAEMEIERNHVVRVKVEDDINALALERVETEPSVGEFAALGAEAEFAHLLHGGRAITGELALSDEDEEYLGLPGLLNPEQTATLLASRDAELKRNVQASLFDVPEESSPAATTWRDLEALRREVHQLVGSFAFHSGRQHGDVHIELRRAVPGPPSASAPLDTLLARRDYLLGKVS